MPYQDTTISPSKSIGQIMEMLTDVGFERVGQMSEKGRHVVLAQHGTSQFRFEANTEKIFNVLYQRRSRERAELQARRIAWRIIWNQVKNACDAIRYDVVEVADVFGGYLEFSTPEGRTTLGRFVAQGVASGAIGSSQSIAGLLTQR